MAYQVWIFTAAGDAIIKSGNFSAGSAGFQIKGDGSAEFNNVTVRGMLKACTLDTSNTMTVKGTIQTDGYTHESAGWQLHGNGNADFRFVSITGDLETVDITTGRYWRCSRIESSQGIVISGNTSTGDAQNESLFSTDGNTLYWKDASGGSHLIV